MREIVEGFFSSCMINLNFGENGKSNSSTALYFISTCGEFFTCGESFFHLHSSTTLYFIFIFIKIIFLLSYFHFFSLSSFLFSSSFSTPVTHSTVQDPRPTANPDRQDPRQTQIGKTHDKPKPTPSKPKPRSPPGPKPKPMNKPKSAETKTQTHRQPNHHQKINKGEGRAMENRGRERRKEGEHSGEKKTGEMK